MFEFIFGFEIYVACDRSERLYAMMMDKWTVNILTTTDEFPLVVSSLSSFLLGSLFIGGDYINRCWFIDFNISNNKHSFKIFPPRPVCWPCSPLVVWFFSPSPILFHFTFSCCSKLLLLFFFSFRWLGSLVCFHLIRLIVQIPSRDIFCIVVPSVCRFSIDIRSIIHVIWCDIWI